MAIEFRQHSTRASGSEAASGRASAALSAGSSRGWGSEEEE